MNTQAKTQTATQNEMNMMNIITELQATISTLRKEIDTTKYNPSFKSSDFKSKMFQEIFDTDSYSFVSKNFNAALNPLKKLADYMTLNKISDLKPLFNERSGKAINLVNAYLDFMGKEKIKPIRIKDRV